jgi:peptidyl-prolyl cis-trans isomerase SurA
MKKLVSYSILSALLTALPLTVCAQGIPVDGYAAMVNDRVITVGDVMSLVQPAEQQLRAMYEGRELEEKLEETFESARRSLIERALILEEFEKSEAELPDRVVDDHINTIIRERFENNRALFYEALAEQRVTIEEWREEVREQLIVIVSRRQQVSTRVTVTPREIRERYEERLNDYTLPAQINVNMIAINKGETPEENEVKRAEAETLVTRIRGGEDFAIVAREASEGSRASEGGAWGWIAPDAMRKELSDTLQDMKPGEISDVIETAEGYYIVALEGRREKSVTPLESVKEELREELRVEKQQEVYDAWMNRLEEKFYVKVF